MSESPQPHQEPFHGAETTILVTCADPRVHPEAFLGLEAGEALVFRTVAGHPQPALQDLATLDIEFGGIEDMMIIYHTG